MKWVCFLCYVKTIILTVYLKIVGQYIKDDSQMFTYLKNRIASSIGLLFRTLNKKKQHTSKDI